MLTCTCNSCNNKIDGIAYRTNCLHLLCPTCIQNNLDCNCPICKNKLTKGSLTECIVGVEPPPLMDSLFQIVLQDTSWNSIISNYHKLFEGLEEVNLFIISQLHMKSICSDSLNNVINDNRDKINELKKIIDSISNEKKITDKRNAEIEEELVLKDKDIAELKDAYREKFRKCTAWEKAYNTIRENLVNSDNNKLNQEQNIDNFEDNKQNFKFNNDNQFNYKQNPQKILNPYANQIDRDRNYQKISPNNILEDNHLKERPFENQDIVYHPIRSLRQKLQVTSYTRGYPESELTSRKRESQDVLASNPTSTQHHYQQQQQAYNPTIKNSYQNNNSTSYKIMKETDKKYNQQAPIYCKKFEFDNFRGVNNNNNNKIGNSFFDRT